MPPLTFGFRPEEHHTTAVRLALRFTPRCLVNSRDVWILYRQELRSALRERNIVIYSVLLPLLLYPLLLWAIFSAITFVKGETEGFVARVAIENLAPEHDALRLALSGDPKIDLVATATSHEAL